MKKIMNLKRWTLLVAMIGVLLVTAFANERDEEERSDRLKERMTFFKENVKPRVDAQRVKLEELLSEEDKKEIERLREEIISQRLLENEFFFEARAMRIKGEEVSESLMLELKAQRIAIENLHDDAKIIANKYRPEIDEMLVELKDSREEWKAHMGPRKGEGYSGEGHKKQMKGRKGHGNHPGMRGMRLGENNRRDLGMVTFLLWDVDRG